MKTQAQACLTVSKKVERIDPIDIEFLINSPEAKAEAQKVRDYLKKIGQEAELSQAEINDLLAKLKALEATPGLDVPAKKAAKAKSTFNGLGNSINQITRELPAFTYSAQTGFLALSNNIPILADEIGRLRKENDELVASGKKGVPVWKSVIGNLFSWNVALSLGITLVTVYGKEIANFFSELFKGRTAIDEHTKSVEALNKAYESNEYQKVIKDLIELRSNIKLAKDGVIDKKVALDQFNKTLGKVTTETQDLNEAERIVVEKSPAYIEAMLYKTAATLAAADAAKQLADNALKQFETEEKIAAKQKEEAEARAKGVSTASQAQGNFTNLAANSAAFRQKVLADELDELEKEADEIAKKGDDIVSKLKERAAAIRKAAGLTDEDGNPDPLRKEINERKKLLEKIADLDREYARKQLDRDAQELQALRDKFAKVRALIEEFNADPKNAKAKIDLTGLGALQETAEADLIYKQDTRSLKKELETQKELYREFEEYRKLFGTKKAKERYKNELGAFEDYASYLKDVVDRNKDAFDAVDAGTATGGQAERMRLLDEQLSAEQKRQSQHLDTLLSDFLSYEQERAKIVERYNEIRQALQEDNRGFDADKLDREFQAELDKLDLAQIKVDERYKALYGDIRGMGEKAIQQIIVKAREMVNALEREGKVSTEIIATINKQIDALEAGGSDRQATRLRELAYMFQEVGNSIGGVFGDIVDDIANTVGLLSNALQVMNNDTASGLTKITSMIGLFTTAYNLLNKAVQWLNRDKELEAQQQINESLLERIKVEQKLNEIHRERNELIREANVLLDSYYKDDYASAVRQQAEMLATMEDSIAALASGALVEGTGRTSGFFGIGAKDKQYNFNLNEVLGFITGDNSLGYGDVSNGTRLDAFIDTTNAVEDILNKMGKTAQDVARFTSAEWMDFFELLDASGRITEETTKELLDTARESLQEYQAALEEMRGIIRDFAGDLSSQLSTSLQDAFRTGEDAAEHFRQSINRVLLNIFMQDLINQQFRQFFNSLQEEMEASMGVGGDQNWIDDIKRFSDQITPRLDAAMEAMQIFDDELQAAGYEGFGSSDSAAASGLQGAIRREMTEETASELTGLFRGQYDITKKHFQLSERWFAMEQKCCDATMSIMASNALIEENTRNTVIQVMYAVAELKTISKQTKSASGRDLGKPGG